MAQEEIDYVSTLKAFVATIQQHYDVIGSPLPPPSEVVTTIGELLLAIVANAE